MLTINADSGISTNSFDFLIWGKFNFPPKMIHNINHWYLFVLRSNYLLHIMNEIPTAVNDKNIFHYAIL